MPSATLRRLLRLAVPMLVLAVLAGCGYDSLVGTDRQTAPPTVSPDGQWEARVTDSDWGGAAGGSDTTVDVRPASDRGDAWRNIYTGDSARVSWVAGDTIEVSETVDHFFDASSAWQDEGSDSSSIGWRWIVGLVVGLVGLAAYVLEVVLLTRTRRQSRQPDLETPAHRGGRHLAAAILIALGVGLLVGVLVFEVTAPLQWSRGRQVSSSLSPDGSWRASVYEVAGASQSTRVETQRLDGEGVLREVYSGPEARVGWFDDRTLDIRDVSGVAYHRVLLAPGRGFTSVEYLQNEGGSWTSSIRSVLAVALGLGIAAGATVVAVVAWLATREHARSSAETPSAQQG